MKNKNKFLVKFLVVAIAVGVLSPSVSFTSKIVEDQGYQASVSQLHISLFNVAEAKKKDARPAAKKRTKKSSNPKARTKTKNTNKNKNKNSNKNVNVNKNVNANVNVNKNVNVNVNHNNHGRYGHYHGRPLVAFTTALVVGTMVAAATMPTTCTVVVVNGINYKRCDNAYYQPFYEGDTLVYKVVNSPL